MLFQSLLRQGSHSFEITTRVLNPFAEFQSLLRQGSHSFLTVLKFVNLFTDQFQSLLRQGSHSFPALCHGSAAF